MTTVVVHYTRPWVWIVALGCSQGFLESRSRVETRMLKKGREIRRWRKKPTLTHTRWKGNDYFLSKQGHIIEWWKLIQLPCLQYHSVCNVLHGWQKFYHIYNVTSWNFRETATCCSLSRGSCTILFLVGTLTLHGDVDWWIKYTERAILSSPPTTYATVYYNYHSLLDHPCFPPPNKAKPSTTVIYDMHAVRHHSHSRPTMWFRMPQLMHQSPTDICYFTYPLWHLSNSVVIVTAAKLVTTIHPFSNMICNTLIAMVCTSLAFTVEVFDYCIHISKAICT